MQNKLMLFAVMAVIVATTMPVSATIITTATPQSTDIIASSYQQYEYMVAQPSYTAYFNEKPLGAHFIKVMIGSDQLNFKFYDPNPNNVKAVVNGKNIRYNGIATDTDVWYDIKSDMIKETIKLYNANGSIIKSRIQTELTPMIVKGDILWKRGSETIFTMPRSYATDTNNNFIYGDYVLTQNGLNWDIAISISASWLASAVYPVEVDPTIVVGSTSSSNSERVSAMDSSGNLYISVGGTAGGSNITIYKSTDNGGTWPEWKSYSDTWTAGAHVLVISNTSIAIIGWSDNNLSMQSWYLNGTLRKSSTKVRIGAGNIYAPTCIVNSSYSILCAYREYTTNTEIRFSAFDFDGTVSTDGTLISAPAVGSDYPGIATDATNKIYVFYGSGSVTNYRKWNGTAWETAVQVTNTIESYWRKSIAVSTTGKMLVVARNSGLGGWLNFYNGTAWVYGTAGLNMSNGTISGYTASVDLLSTAVLTDGTFYILGGNTTDTFYTTTTSGTSWSAWTHHQLVNSSSTMLRTNIRWSYYPTSNNITQRLDYVVTASDSNTYYYSILFNAPPVVTINYPTNTTILASNITMNWTVSDDLTATLTCWRYLDGVQKYTGSIANGTTTNEFMNNVSIGSHNVSVTCQDGAPANTTSTTYFSVLHWNETNQTFSNPVYETNLTSFNITLGVAGNVANITGNLTYNNTIYPATTTAVGSTFVLNVTNLRVPLVETNNTVKNFNWSYVVAYTNGTNTSAQTSTNYNHSVYWAYYITSIASPTTALELDNVTFNTTVATQLQVATLSTNTTFNGTAYTTSVVANSSTQRNYSTSIIMPNPPASSTLYVWNSTLYVSYGNQSFARASSNSNITVKQMVLALCVGNATLPAFNFTFYTEEDDKIVNATNLSSTANKFEATFWAFKSGSTFQRNYTFNLSGNVSYPICLEHNETSFLVDAHIRYYNTSYSTRNYFLENYTVDNVTDNISLYLLETTLSSPISFEIRESNGINPAASVVIQALRFYPDKNVYRIVAMALTDGDGKGFSYLKMNTVFHKFKLYRDGEFKREIEQGVLGGADVAAGLTLTYSLTVTSLAEIMEIYEQVVGSCTSNNATAIVTCTYADSSTHLQTMYLTVQRLSNVSWTAICTNSSITDNGTLTCDASGGGNGTYYYWLYGKFASSSLLTIKIADGSFYVGQLNIFGTAGLLFSAILIIALVMIGSFNPIVTIFMGITGLVASSILGMLDISLAALVGIIIVGIIIAIKSRG